jgi:hypothetical protein
MSHIKSHRVAEKFQGASPRVVHQEILIVQPQLRAETMLGLEIKVALHEQEALSCGERRFGRPWLVD